MTFGGSGIKGITNVLPGQHPPSPLRYTLHPTGTGTSNARLLFQFAAHCW